MHRPTDRPTPSGYPPLRSLRSWGALALVALLAGCGEPPELEEDAAAVVVQMARAEGQTGWTSLTPVPEPRTEVSVAAIGHRVYLLGGFVAPEEGVEGARPRTPTTLWAYDVVEGEWTDEGEIPGGTHHAALVALDGRLYLIGGYVEASFEPRGDVHIYDPDTGSWSQGEPMPTPRGALAWAAVDGRIHTVGGTVADKDALHDHEHTTDSPDASVGTHEVYHPAEDRWERRAPMPTARNHHIAQAVDGRVVVTAGRAGRDFTMTTTEIYDPATDSWSTGAPLPTGRSGVASAVLDGWMYVFGGETFDPGAQGTFEEAERYHLGDDRWEAIDPMPSARHGLGAAAAGGAIYVVSGGPRPGFAFGTANERWIPE